MDRKGYSAGADTDAQPPSPTTPPPGRQAEEWGGVHGRDGTPLLLQLSMSNSQWLADRRHHFCHFIITNGKRVRTMTGSVCEREDLMDSSVISVHKGRAGKWCEHPPGLVHGYGPWHTITYKLNARIDHPGAAPSPVSHDLWWKDWLIFRYWSKIEFLSLSRVKIWSSVTCWSEWTNKKTLILKQLIFQFIRISKFEPKFFSKLKNTSLARGGIHMV